MHLSVANNIIRVLLPAVLFLLQPEGTPAQASGNPESIRRINGSIEFTSNDPAGATLQTVNGGVRITSGAIAGDISTVNGPIHIQTRAVAGMAQTVNGTITVDPEARIEGTVQSVNGSVSVEPESRIEGDVATVNGLIRVDNARVAGSIRTVNGNILIRADSIIGGDIRFSEAQTENGWIPRLFGFGNGAQRIRLDIGANVTVEGDIHLYREVELHIDDSAHFGEIIRHY